jgi:hypothetical protein
VQPPLRDDDAARNDDDRAPPPSPRVRLEVELLASEQPVELPAPTTGDIRQPHTVLVVIADADVRQYVRVCLRDRDDLRIVEAATIAMATQLAALDPPRLLIVDAPDARVLETVTDIRAVLMAEDDARGVPPNARITTLPRPFGGQDLESLVDRLLATD